MVYIELLPSATIVGKKKNHTTLAAPSVPPGEN
jgi:hypothetical protein